MTERRLIARHVLARQLGVRCATLAKWEKSWLPLPVQRISDRLILYDLDAVERAVAARAARPRPKRTPKRA